MLQFALVLLSLVLIAIIVLAILTRHPAAIIGAAVITAIIVLFVLFVWPGWIRTALWPPTGTGGDNGPTTSACANPGDMVERDAKPDGTHSLVCGPALYEQPGVIGKVNAGETKVLVGYGSWWSFPSQNALDSRWPSHLREFLAKCQADGWNCVVDGPRPESDAVAPVYVAGDDPQPPLPASPPVVAPCDNGEYTVAQGDSLSGIAQALGLDWQILAARNGIGSPYVIRAGQTLCLP